MAPKRAAKAPVEAPPPTEEEMRAAMEEKRQWLKRRASVEEKNSRHNLNKIQESWLKIMRAAKTKSLRREVEAFAQTHERDVDRKDALLQMLDRDLDESEEQHAAAVRAHLQSLDTLRDVQASRLSKLQHMFDRDVAGLVREFAAEEASIRQQHGKDVREVKVIIKQAEAEERAIDQLELTDHQSLVELVRNRHIEDDHHMRSLLEERIELLKERCNSQLASYRSATVASANDYRSYLQRDSQLSAHVERRVRAVERTQNSIMRCRQKASQTRQECARRHSLLAAERDRVGNYFRQLKARTVKEHSAAHDHLSIVSQAMVNCREKLDAQLGLAGNILRAAQLCSKLETEREKVMAFYPDVEVDVETLNFADEKVAREVREALSCEQPQLHGFWKRYNKVALDAAAVDNEVQRLKDENAQLKTILQQFLEGVSVSSRALDGPNALMVVNGRVAHGQAAGA